MSEKPKWTRGPWKIEPKSNRGLWIYQAGIAGNYVALATRMESEAEEDANARLIAAAPELYEAALLALKTAESWIHDQLDGTGGLESELAMLEPVRVALRKARGETDA